MKTIPTCVARTSVGNATMSIYRTAEGRLALERAEGAGLELYDNIDDVIDRVPAAVADSIRANTAGAGVR
jgi:hypothetical protein